MYTLQGYRLAAAVCLSAEAPWRMPGVKRTKQWYTVSGRLQLARRGANGKVRTEWICSYNMGVSHVSECVEAGRLLAGDF